MSVPQTVGQGLALDARALDALRRDASRDPQAAVRKAAGQFEALFMQQLLESMRKAMPKSGMFDGPGHETYVGMLDQQLSQSLAGRPGGLAAMIERQLTRHLAAPSTGAGGPSAAAPAAPARPADASTAAARARQPSPALDVQAAERLKTSLSARLDGAQVDFVNRMWPHALAAQRSTGVPAAYVVGQAALESGWGKSEIRHDDGRNSHNLFGIKAGASWKGATVDVATTEFIDGKPQRVTERFRAYGSYAEAFRDWGALMSGHARYGQVLRGAQSVEGFAQGMQRAGYATDPRYGDKLERTINQTLRLGRLVV